jgi:hypothetical protein
MSYSSPIFRVRTSAYLSLNSVNLTMFCDTCVGVLQHRHNVIDVTRPGDPSRDPDYGLEYTVSTFSEMAYIYIYQSRHD